MPQMPRSSRPDCHLGMRRHYYLVVLSGGPVSGRVLIDYIILTYC